MLCANVVIVFVISRNTIDKRALTEDRRELLSNGAGRISLSNYCLAVVMRKFITVITDISAVV